MRLTEILLNLVINSHVCFNETTLNFPFLRGHMKLHSRQELACGPYVVLHLPLAGHLEEQVFSLQRLLLGLGRAR